MADFSTSLEVLDLEFFSANRGEFLFSPGLMPCEAAVETVFRIVDTVLQLTDRGLQSCSAFEIDGAHRYIAGALRHAVQLLGGRGHDLGVMLGYDMLDHGKVGAIVESDALFAVMNVQIVGHHMLAQNKSVPEALSRHIAQHIIVVLVTGGNKACSVTGIGLQFLAQKGVSNLFIQAELRVRNIYTRYILQSHRRLRGVHFIFVQMYSKL